MFFKEEWQTKWFIHFEYILNFKKGITLSLELHFEQQKGHKKVKDTDEQFSLKREINLSLNDDLTIEKEDSKKIRSFIQSATQFLDEQLINKK